MTGGSHQALVAAAERIGRLGPAGEPDDPLPHALYVCEIVGTEVEIQDRRIECLRWEIVERSDGTTDRICMDWEIETEYIVRDIVECDWDNSHHSYDPGPSVMIARPRSSSF